MRPLVVCLFGTGARLSEALYLDWSNVDLAAHRVRFLETKNGKARGAPLNDRLLVELANLEHRDGAVFRRPDGQPYARRVGVSGQVTTAFKGACRRAGVEHLTPHDCRHTWASWFFAETRDLRALMELGGWKSERMVFRYTHLNPDHLAAAINRLPWEISGSPDKEVPIRDLYQHHTAVADHLAKVGVVSSNLIARSSFSGTSDQRPLAAVAFVIGNGRGPFRIVAQDPPHSCAGVML